MDRKSTRLSMSLNSLTQSPNSTIYKKSKRFQCKYLTNKIVFNL